MRKGFLILCISVLFACQSTNDEYLITSSSVGLISNDTRVNEVADLYPDDSLRTINLDNKLADINKKYELYSADGDPLLVLEPTGTADTSKIAQVEVISPLFKTRKGLHADSNFKKVYDNYEISSIQRTLVNVIINLKKEGIFLAIDNESLPDDIQYDDDAMVKATQIPDDAAIKYFWVNLN